MSQEDMALVPEVVSSCAFDLQSIECSADIVTAEALAPLLISASWEEVFEPLAPNVLVLTFLDQDTVPELKLLQAFVRASIASLQIGVFHTDGKVCARNTFTGLRLHKIARDFDSFAEEGAIATRVVTFHVESIVETIVE